MLQHELNVIKNTIEKAEALGLTRVIQWATHVLDAIQKELDEANAAEVEANAVLANVPAEAVTLTPSEPVVVETTAQSVAPPVDNDHVAPGATLFTAEEIALNAATTTQEAAVAPSSVSTEDAATSATVAPQPSPTVTE